MARTTNVGEDVQRIGPMAMSPCGQYFANATLSGQLNVWDTMTTELLAQYIPSTHLSSGCTKISWPPIKFEPDKLNQINGSTNADQNNSFNNTDIVKELKKLCLLAMGTENGTTFLFSVQKNEVYSILGRGSSLPDGQDQDGHCLRINDICWLPQHDSIFTCSNDKFVIEWSITEAKIKRKTMLDSTIITSICLLDNDNLITGSNLLKWWNWPQKRLLKMFHGHSNEVQFLRHIVFSQNSNKIDKTLTSKDVYLISSAISDRYVNFWKLTCDTETNGTSAAIISSNPLTSFLLDDEPISLELSFTDLTNPIYVLCTSKSGYFYLFEHFIDPTSTLPTKSNGPYHPKYRLEIQTQINSGWKDFGLNNGTSNVGVPQSASIKNKRKRAKLERMIPILYSYLEQQQLQSNKNQNNNIITLIYGLANRPTFERISFVECEKLCQKSNLNTTKSNEGVIVKDAAILKSLELLQKPTVINLNTRTNIKQAQETDKTTVIGPAGMISRQPLYNNINGLLPMDNGDAVNGGVGADEHRAEEMISEEEIDVENQRKRKASSKFNNQDKPTKNVAKTPPELTLDEQLKAMEFKSKPQMNDIDKSAAKSCSEQPKANESSSDGERKSSKMMKSVKQTKVKNDQSSQVVAVDSLVNVLVQGLKSNDEKLLSTALQSSRDDGKQIDEQIVINTVKKLPMEHVPRLLVELQKRLCYSRENHMVYLKWITMLLKHQISYLMTIPNISEEFLPLKELLLARTAVLEKCFQLKGRLDLILEQTQQSQTSTIKNDKISFTKPKLTYESDSSESEDEDDDMGDGEEGEEEEEIMSIDDNDLMGSDEEELIHDQENDSDDEIKDSDMDADEELDETSSDDDDEHEDSAQDDQQKRSRRKKPETVEEGDD